MLSTAPSTRKSPACETAGASAARGGRKDPLWAEGAEPVPSRRWRTLSRWQLPSPGLLFTEARFQMASSPGVAACPVSPARPGSFPLRGQDSLGHQAGTGLGRHMLAVILALLQGLESKLVPGKACGGGRRGCLPPFTWSRMCCRCLSGSLWASASCARSRVGDAAVGFPLMPLTNVLFCV